MYHALLEDDDELDDDDLEEDTDANSESTVNDKKPGNNEKWLARLPDEVQVLVFSYVPHRLRLLVLSEKYQYTYYSRKLDSLPINMKTYSVLFKYAISVSDMLEDIHRRSSYMRSFGVIYNCMDWINNVIELERRGNFEKHVLSYRNAPVKSMILEAFQHYREIYLRDRSGKGLHNAHKLQYEAAMTRLYAFVAAI